MKTNTIFLALLGSAALAVFTPGCTKTETVQAPDTTDTIYNKEKVPVSVLGVTSVQAPARDGVNSLAFEPYTAWTWSIEDGQKNDWLDLETVSGSATDKVLRYQVTENASIKERTLKTVVKVGKAICPLTVRQKGTAPYIEVYCDEIVLSKAMTEAYITNIVSNVELVSVKSMPSWIESVEVERVDDYEGAHQAFVVLKPWDFDGGEREGDIVFAGKDATDKSYKIRCAAFEDKYIVDRSNLKDTLAVKEKTTLPAVSIYVNPGQTEELGYVIYRENRGAYLLQTWATGAWVDSRAPYAMKQFAVTFDALIGNPNYGHTTAAVFVMPQSEVAAFTPAKAAATKPTFSVTRAPFSFIDLDNRNVIVNHTFRFTIPSVLNKVKIKVVEGMMPKIEITGSIRFQRSDFTAVTYDFAKDPAPYVVENLTKTETVDGFDIYTFDLRYTDDFNGKISKDEAWSSIGGSQSVKLSTGDDPTKAGYNVTAELTLHTVGTPQ